MSLFDEIKPGGIVRVWIDSTLLHAKVIGFGEDTSGETFLLAHEEGKPWAGDIELWKDGLAEYIQGADDNCVKGHWHP